MNGRLFYIKLTQSEMYDLMNTANIKHHILYDSGARVAVEITAEVEEAPLLSEVGPYDVILDTSYIEEYLSGRAKPIQNLEEITSVPCVTGFEVQELIGDDYLGVRQSLVALRDAKKVLEDKVREIRKECLKTKLVQPLGEVPRQEITSLIF